MHNHAHGFTFPELLTTLGILALLTSVVTPSALQFIDSHQLTTASNRAIRHLLPSTDIDDGRRRLLNQLGKIWQARLSKKRMPHQQHGQ